MATLIVHSWENNNEPLKNENGWPNKGFEIRLLKCTELNKKELKSALKEITQKTIKEISLNTNNNEHILPLIDYFTYYGANVEVVEK